MSDDDASERCVRITSLQSKMLRGLRAEEPDSIPYKDTTRPEGHTTQVSEGSVTVTVAWLQ